MAAAASTRQAATAAQICAAAARLFDLLAGAGDDDASRGLLRLLEELAAVRQLAPKRQPGQEAAAGRGWRGSARRRRAQRERATRARFGERDAVAREGGDGKGGEQHVQSGNPLDQFFVPRFPACVEEQDGGAQAAIEHNSIAASGAAVGGASRRQATQTTTAESAAEEGAEWVQRPAALAAAPEQLMAQTMEQEGQTEQGRVQVCMEPRAAAAAEPHKRRAVAAGTAVETVDSGGKTAASGEGAWTTVTPRRARRQARARVDGWTSGAARKAAAARAAATRRTVAAVLEHYGE